MKDETLDRATSYIKDWLRFKLERDDIPGMAVGISYKGKLLMNETYGFANVEKRQRLTTDHLFRIASHSKTFTATAVMQLQEQDKLAIDEPIAKCLNWLQAHKDRRWQKVTIRQLMSHGAGVIRDGNQYDFWNVTEPFPDEAKFKQEILQTDLVIDNNIKLKYSNYGYTLLGMIIEAVSKKSFNQFVTDNIVRPLGLKNTGPELEPRIADKLVTGYSRLGPNKKRLPIVQINTKAMAPATGFYSNATDMCAYFRAQMIGSGKLLSDESKKEMQKAQWRADNVKSKIEYGLGLEIGYSSKLKTIGHTGGFPGNSTNSMFEPKNELVVSVLTNANGASASYINKSIYKVLDNFMQFPMKPKYQKYQGRYLNLWNNMDIVALGEKLICGNADNWEPLIGADELDYHKGNIFKITKTDSFGSSDEYVEFNLDSNQKVTSINFAGSNFYPEKTYFQKMVKTKVIGEGIK